MFFFCLISRLCFFLTLLWMKQGNKLAVFCFNCRWSRNLIILRAHSLSPVTMQITSWTWREVDIHWICNPCMLSKLLRCPNDTPSGAVGMDFLPRFWGGVSYVLISPEVLCMLPFIAPKLVKSANKLPTAGSLDSLPVWPSQQLRQWLATFGMKMKRPFMRMSSHKTRVCITFLICFLLCWSLHENAIKPRHGETKKT